MTTIEKNFIRFLKDNNAYYIFVCNLLTFKKLTIEEYLHEFPHSPDNFISSAFTWFQTEEGEKPWMKLNSKWLKEYENIKTTETSTNIL